MAIEKQRLANQQSALKSTGPKTAEGKENSKRNALKRGLAGSGKVLKHADERKLQKTLEAWRERLQPIALDLEVPVPLGIDRSAERRCRLRALSRIGATTPSRRLRSHHFQRNPILMSKIPMKERLTSIRNQGHQTGPKPSSGLLRAAMRRPPLRFVHFTSDRPLACGTLRTAIKDCVLERDAHDLSTGVRRDRLRLAWPGPSARRLAQIVARGGLRTRMVAGQANYRTKPPMHLSHGAFL
jgi:hypothetical protein